MVERIGSNSKIPVKVVSSADIQIMYGNGELQFVTEETFSNTLNANSFIYNGVVYINSDKTGALDMAGDIQANTEAINGIKENITELSNDLTTEVAAREEGDANTLNSAKEYVDNRLIWEQF